MQIPVRGWAVPFVQEDEHGCACVADHPVGPRRALEGRGARPRRDAELPALARRLAADPAPVLAALAPPFALTWWPGDADEALLQTDGLGQARLFEYDDGTPPVEVALVTLVAEALAPADAWRAAPADA